MLMIERERESFCLLMHYGLYFQVVDLQVFASPRITLKPLVPSFPCFAKILVSLMEKVGNLGDLYFFCAQGPSLSSVRFLMY